jgi:hypothetical protein
MGANKTEPKHSRKIEIVLKTMSYSIDKNWEHQVAQQDVTFLHVRPLSPCFTQLTPIIVLFNRISSTPTYFNTET